MCFDSDHVIAVISYHRGGPLSKWWKRHRKLNRGQKVGENAVARVLLGACKALKFCHMGVCTWTSRKTISSSVEVSGMKVVLIDFGCAVSVADTGGRVVDRAMIILRWHFCCMAPEVLSIAVRRCVMKVLQTHSPLLRSALRRMYGRLALWLMFC